jgi:hypothetical protein
VINNKIKHGRGLGSFGGKEKSENGGKLGDRIKSYIKTRPETI